jgi:hypothetical protein
MSQMFVEEFEAYLLFAFDFDVLPAKRWEENPVTRLDDWGNDAAGGRVRETGTRCDDLRDAESGQYTVGMKANRTHSRFRDLFRGGRREIETRGGLLHRPDPLDEDAVEERLESADTGSREGLCDGQRCVCRG